MMNAARIKLSALEADPLLAGEYFSAATLDGHGLPVGRVDDPIEEAILRVGWWPVGTFGSVCLVRSLVYLRTHYLVRADPAGLDAWAVPVLIEDDREGATRRGDGGAPVATRGDGVEVARGRAGAPV